METPAKTVQEGVLKLGGASVACARDAHRSYGWRIQKLMVDEADRLAHKLGGDAQLGDRWLSS